MSEESTIPGELLKKLLRKLKSLKQEDYTERRSAIHQICQLIEKTQDNGEPEYGFVARYHAWLEVNRVLLPRFELTLDDNAMKLMSLFDAALSYPKRWGDQTIIPEEDKESVTEHHKQSMNRLQKTFSLAKQAKARVDSEGRQRALHALDQHTFNRFKAAAMLGMNLHDAGEMCGEFTTLGGMALISGPEQLRAIKQRKDALEGSIVATALEYGVECLQADDLGVWRFGSAMSEARDAVRRIEQQPGVQMDVATVIELKELAIREALSRKGQTLSDTMSMGSTSGAVSGNFWSIYCDVEDEARGSFLHPLVKICESLEGTAKFQRVVSRSYVGKDHIPADLITGQHVLVALNSAEKYMPRLFDPAQRANVKWVESITALLAPNLRGQNHENPEGISKGALDELALEAAYYGYDRLSRYVGGRLKGSDGKAVTEMKDAAWKPVCNPLRFVDQQGKNQMISREALKAQYEAARDGLRDGKFPRKANLPDGKFPRQLHLNTDERSDLIADNLLRDGTWCGPHLEPRTVVGDISYINHFGGQDPSGRS